MVRNILSLGRNGLSDWLIQRVSAVILGIYFIGLLGFMLMTPDLGYAEWQTLFSRTWMRIASLAALLALCAHAWIGMWVIATDYLNNYMIGNKGTVIRLTFQAACALLIFIYLVWGVQILWGL